MLWQSSTCTSDGIQGNRAGNLSYYLYDGLGSTRALSDGAGSLTATYHYDAFGVEVARTGDTPNDYLFTGEQFDSSLGFYYLRARYLNPRTGRMHTMDTFQGVMNDPRTLHKYLYAANDPVNLIDPSGNFFTLGGFSQANSIQGFLVATAITAPLIGQSLLDGSIEGPLTDKEIGLLTIMATSPLLAAKLMDLIGAKDQAASDTIVPLYRAVERPELLSIMACNCFSVPDFGFGIEPTAVKRFFLSSPSAITFGNKFFKGQITFYVVEARVSSRFFAALPPEPPGDAFIGPGIAVPLGLLPALNAEVARHGGIINLGEF